MEAANPPLNNPKNTLDFEGRPKAVSESRDCALPEPSDADSEIFARGPVSSWWVPVLLWRSHGSDFRGWFIMTPGLAAWAMMDPATGSPYLVQRSTEAELECNVRYIGTWYHEPLP